MPLTAEDVRNKRFTTVRLREGYDMSEVDQFLDEVEAELRRLGGEGDELRSRLQEFTGEPVQASSTSGAPAAARLLELAATNADQLLEEAQEQARQLRSDAQSEAERMSTESRTSAERVEAEARSRAQRLDAETTERRQQLFGELERQKAALNTEVERLRTFEREYRAELKGYFQAQLEALEGQSEGGLLGFREAGARGADTPGEPTTHRGNGAGPVQG